MKEYIKKGILITCFHTPSGFRFYFKDLIDDYLHNPVSYENIDRGDGTIKTMVIIPYYESFDKGLEEMKKEADIYLEKNGRTTKD